MIRLRATFASLSNRNYRLYFAGQAVSLTGTWMQRLGQAWLVLELSGSPTLLGVVTAAQFLPLLLAGPWGGLIADRVDKRRLLLWTQSSAGALALLLGLLTLSGLVQLWMVMLFALGLGVVTALDNPARQSFVLEMVGPDHVTNAVTLNSIVVNAARAVGPAAAGVLIATAGVAPTFLVDATSYFAVVGALLLMRREELHAAPPTRRGPGQLREGLAYVRRSPGLLAPLALMAIVGTLAYEFQVVLPVLARQTFAGGADTLGMLNSALGIGAVAGGLLAAGALKPSTRSLVLAALSFGTFILLAAGAPTLPLALVALFGVGAASITFLATGNSLLQLRAAPAMRGRVMALWSMAFLGTTPLGGPLIGWVAEVAGARVALGLGGAATVAGGLALVGSLRWRAVHAQPDVVRARRAGAATGRPALRRPLGWHPSPRRARTRAQRRAQQRADAA